MSAEDDSISQDRQVIEERDSEPKAARNEDGEQGGSPDLADYPPFANDKFLPTPVLIALVLIAAVASAYPMFSSNSAVIVPEKTEDQSIDDLNTADKITESPPPEDPQSSDPEKNNLAPDNSLSQENAKVEIPPSAEAGPIDPKLEKLLSQTATDETTELDDYSLELDGQCDDQEYVWNPNAPSDEVGRSFSHYGSAGAIGDSYALTGSSSSNSGRPASASRGSRGSSKSRGSTTRSRRR